jgi:CubicO group peptidase (beta-lactamase class C family)
VTLGAVRAQLFIAVAAVASVGCAHTPAPAVARAAPVPHWEHVSTAEAAGFSTERLAKAVAYAHTLNTAALMVVVSGKVLVEEGDLTHESYIASVRKSVLAMLMGTDASRVRVRLDATLAELNIDDVGGLTDDEKRATVKDLLTARSGVFHAASNPGDDLASAPPRGSQKPGEYFLYSNWDFNVLGDIYEKQTGRNIYDAFELDLARPLGMEDFHRDAQKKSGDTTASQYLAYHFTLSTRDLARLGLLMAYEGEWNGVQLLPREWVRTITTTHVKREALHPEKSTTGPFGYGYLWWTWDDPDARAGGTFSGAYTGLGAFGQYITVIPKLNLVIAHNTLPDEKRQVSVNQYLKLLSLLTAAACSGPCR